MAVLRRGKAEIIPNQEGQILTPSVVSFTESGEVLVGAAALRRAVEDPRRTIYSIKRLLGRVGNQVQVFADRAAYEVVSDSREAAQVLVDGRLCTPVEILVCLLVKLKSAV